MENEKETSFCKDSNFGNVNYEEGKAPLSKDELNCSTGDTREETVVNNQKRNSDSEECSHTPPLLRHDRNSDLVEKEVDNSNMDAAGKPFSEIASRESSGKTTRKIAGEVGIETIEGRVQIASHSTESALEKHDAKYSSKVSGKEYVESPVREKVGEENVSLAGDCDAETLDRNCGGKAFEEMEGPASPEIGPRKSTGNRISLSSQSPISSPPMKSPPIRKRLKVHVFDREINSPTKAESQEKEATRAQERNVEEKSIPNNEMTNQQMEKTKLSSSISTAVAEGASISVKEKIQLMCDNAEVMTCTTDGDKLNDQMEANKVKGIVKLSEESQESGAHPKVKELSVATSNETNSGDVKPMKKKLSLSLNRKENFASSSKETEEHSISSEVVESHETDVIPKHDSVSMDSKSSSTNNKGKDIACNENQNEKDGLCVTKSKRSDHLPETKEDFGRSRCIIRSQTDFQENVQPNLTGNDSNSLLSVEKLDSTKTDKNHDDGKKFSSVYCGDDKSSKSFVKGDKSSRTQNVDIDTAFVMDNVKRREEQPKEYESSVSGAINKMHDKVVVVAPKEDGQVKPVTIAHFPEYSTVNEEQMDRKTFVHKKSDHRESRENANREFNSKGMTDVVKKVEKIEGEIEQCNQECFDRESSQGPQVENECQEKVSENNQETIKENKSNHKENDCKTNKEPAEGRICQQKLDDQETSHEQKVEGKFHQKLVEGECNQDAVEEIKCHQKQPGGKSNSEPTEKGRLNKKQDEDESTLEQAKENDPEKKDTGNYENSQGRAEEGECRWKQDGCRSDQKPFEDQSYHKEVDVDYYQNSVGVKVHDQKEIESKSNQQLVEQDAKCCKKSETETNQKPILGKKIELHRKDYDKMNQKSLSKEMEENSELKVDEKFEELLDDRKLKQSMTESDEPSRFAEEKTCHKNRGNSGQSKKTVELKICHPKGVREKIQEPYRVEHLEMLGKNKTSKEAAGEKISHHKGDSEQCVESANVEEFHEKESVTDKSQAPMDKKMEQVKQGDNRKNQEPFVKKNKRSQEDSRGTAKNEGIQHEESRKRQKRELKDEQMKADGKNVSNTGKYIKMLTDKHNAAFIGKEGKCRFYETFEKSLSDDEGDLIIDETRDEEARRPTKNTLSLSANRGMGRAVMDSDKQSEVTDVHKISNVSKPLLSVNEKLSFEEARMPVMNALSLPAERGRGRMGRVVMESDKQLKITDVHTISNVSKPLLSMNEKQPFEEARSPVKNTLSLSAERGRRRMGKAVMEYDKQSEVTEVYKISDVSKPLLSMNEKQSYEEARSPIKNTVSVPSKRGRAKVESNKQSNLTNLHKEPSVNESNISHVSKPLLSMNEKQSFEKNSSRSSQSTGGKKRAQNESPRSETSKVIITTERAPIVISPTDVPSTVATPDLEVCVLNPVKKPQVECIDLSSDEENLSVDSTKNAVSNVCHACRDVWNDGVLHLIFKGTECVTVNSKITYGAIVCINDWINRNLRGNKEKAITSIFDRADLGRNIAKLNINQLDEWLNDLLQSRKNKCCDVFTAVYGSDKDKAAHPRGKDITSNVLSCQDKAIVQDDVASPENVYMLSPLSEHSTQPSGFSSNPSSAVGSRERVVQLRPFQLGVVLPNSPPGDQGAYSRSAGNSFTRSTGYQIMQPHSLLPLRPLVSQNMMSNTLPLLIPVSSQGMTPQLVPVRHPAITQSMISNRGPIVIPVSSQEKAPPVSTRSISDTDSLIIPVMSQGSTPQLISVRPPASAQSISFVGTIRPIGSISVSSHNTLPTRTPSPHKVLPTMTPQSSHKALPTPPGSHKTLPAPPPGSHKTLPMTTPQSSHRNLPMITPPICSKLQMPSPAEPLNLSNRENQLAYLKTVHGNDVSVVISTSINDKPAPPVPLQHSVSNKQTQSSIELASSRQTGSYELNTPTASPAADSKSKTSKNKKSPSSSSVVPSVAKVSVKKQTIPSSSAADSKRNAPEKKLSTPCSSEKDRGAKLVSILKQQPKEKPPMQQPKEKSKQQSKGNFPKQQAKGKSPKQPVPFSTRTRQKVAIENKEAIPERTKDTDQPKLQKGQPDIKKPEGSVGNNGKCYESDGVSDMDCPPLNEAGGHFSSSEEEADIPSAGNEEHENEGNRKCVISVVNVNNKDETDVQKLLKALGLDSDNFNIYSSYMNDVTPVTNKIKVSNPSESDKVSPCYFSMLKERTALNGFALVTFDHLLYEADNYRSASPLQETVSSRFVTKRELLTLQSIFILNAETPDVNLFYQIFIQILMSRKRCLMIPDSRTLLMVTEDIRKEYNRAKSKDTSIQILNEDWDMHEVYSCPELWLEGQPPEEVTIRDVLSVFCTWKNLEKNPVDKSFFKALQSLCKFSDAKNVDHFGLCFKLYIKFCRYLYGDKEFEIAKTFLDEPFTGPGYIVSKRLLTDVIVPYKDRQHLSYYKDKEGETLQDALDKCEDLVKQTERSLTKSIFDSVVAELVNIKNILEKYNETNHDMLKRLEKGEKRRENIILGIHDKRAGALVKKLTDSVTETHKVLQKRHQECRDYERSCKKQKTDSANSSDSATTVYKEEVPLHIEKLIKDLLLQGVKPNQITDVVSAITNSVCEKQQLKLPSETWIKTFAMMIDSRKE